MKQETLVAPATHAAFAACGIALTASARHVLASEMAAARLLGQLLNAAANRVPVALRLLDPGTGAEAHERMSLVCDGLGHAFRRAGLEPSSLEITVAAGIPGPRAAVEIRSDALGPGTLNFILGDEDILASPVAEDSVWRQLWQLRSGRVTVTCCPAITSRCSLLSPEPATDVIPALGLQAPAQSAWLAGTLDLTGFADASGDIDLGALEQALYRYVNTAEALHDVTVWPTPVMQEDAWFNRRLAIRIDGIGDIAEKRRLDPSAHASKMELDVLLFKVRSVIARRSQLIARARDTLPAIAAANPCGRLQKLHSREAWEMRWLRAIDKSALRHRNLVVMSPWSVFPRRGADIRYSNLLPLLAHADACEFSRRVNVDHWSLDEFVNFHRRVWAVRRSAETAMAVAEQL